MCHLLRLNYNILQYMCCTQRRSRCQGESGGSSWQPVASRRAPHTFCGLRLLGTNKLRQERKVSQRSLRTFCQLKILSAKYVEITPKRTHRCARLTGLIGLTGLSGLSPDSLDSLHYVQFVKYIFPRNRTTSN